MFQYISCYSLSECNASAHRPVERFNTSHVTLYLISKKLLLLVHISFNTSHVTLYPKLQRVSFPPTVVSIHLMLLFIVEEQSSFNGISNVSIHLMLLFISFASASIALVFLFQYISCYSLSICCQISTVVISRFNTSHITLYHVYGRCFYRRSLSFNTSHVTLYPRQVSVNADVPEGFNTSHVTLYRDTVKEWDFQKQFQYISCYSLSANRYPKELLRLSFNTSHVTLYLRRIIACGNQLMFQYISCYSLSIRKSGTESKRETFQYISCYSLSLKTLAEQMLSNKFQYISCYSLSGIPHLRCRDGMEVSIHLMLLFIVHFQIRKMPSNYGFNTSHVTLYRL